MARQCRGRPARYVRAATTPPSAWARSGRRATARHRGALTAAGATLHGRAGARSEDGDFPHGEGSSAPAVRPLPGGSGGATTTPVSDGGRLPAVGSSPDAAARGRTPAQEEAEEEETTNPHDGEAHPHPSGAAHTTRDASPHTSRRGTTPTTRNGGRPTDRPCEEGERTCRTGPRTDGHDPDRRGLQQERPCDRQTDIL